MSEYPRPVRLPGEPSPPREPYQSERHDEPPAVVDDDLDRYGAEEAAARVTERIAQVPAGTAHAAGDGRLLLDPPWDRQRDRVEGPLDPRTTLVVFGAYGTPASRPLAAVLDHVREHHVTDVAISWRHYPDPVAHPHAVSLALATEAADLRGRFWALTHELLRMHHHSPADLNDAFRHLNLDPAIMLDAMRAGTGADRIVDDVTSARRSGVTYTPALFIDGERYDGELDPAAVAAALTIG